MLCIINKAWHSITIYMNARILDIEYVLYYHCVTYILLSTRIYLCSTLMKIKISKYNYIFLLT